MSSIIRRRSGLTVLVSLMESSFLIEAVNTSILRTGALHCYHYYILSTGSRPLGSCPRAAGWSAATSCFDPTATSADRRRRPFWTKPLALSRQAVGESERQP